MSRETDQKPTDPLSNWCHDKTNIISAMFSALLVCTNEAAVTDYCNYMNNKTKQTRGFFCFFVEQEVSREKPIYALFARRPSIIRPKGPC